MGYKFNPLTGNLDDAGSGGSPGGSNTQIQFNDAGAFGGDVDLTWNKTTNVMTVGGDVNLNDGGTYTTTVQCVTPTANRTISFPDATGTVALVAGSSGQLLWNNAGANAGASTLTYDGSILTTSGRFINSYNATASNPAKVFTGTWFTGGTATTTKPHFLVEPTGTTSTAWSTSGTGIGVNAASGFGGRLLDLQANGTSRMVVQGDGKLLVGTTTANTNGGVLQLSGGITFPATQVAASDANTLDDYEEGTWTPQLEFGGATTGITYNARQGYYIKIGKQVFLTVYFNLSSKGTATGSATVTGLPFTSEDFNISGTTGWPGNMPSRRQNQTATNFAMFVSDNTATISITDATGSVLTDTTFTNGTIIECALMYRAAS